MCAASLFAGDRVVTTCIPWMATKQTLDGKNRTMKESIATQCVDCITRARRMKSTGFRATEKEVFHGREE